MESIAPPQYGPYVNRELLEALDREMAHATLLGRPIHWFERRQLLAGRKTTETIKRLYLVWCAVLLGLAMLLSTAARWLVQSANPALGWTFWPEDTALGQRRRRLIDRSMEIERPRVRLPYGVYGRGRR